MKKPTALQSDEQAFIEKTLLYISGIRGNTKTELELSTNTRYPTRYVVIVRGVPIVTLGDVHNICNMNQRIRSVSVNMTDETLCIDVWRAGKERVQNKKRKRSLYTEKTSLPNWDLGSVDKNDRRCLDMFLQRVNGMPNIECQFTVNVDTSRADMYFLDMHILDTVFVKHIERVVPECRSFCAGIEFDFPRRIIRAKCLRIAAPVSVQKRKKLLLRNA